MKRLIALSAFAFAFAAPALAQTADRAKHDCCTECCEKAEGDKKMSCCDHHGKSEHKGEKQDHKDGHHSH